MLLWSHHCWCGLNLLYLKTWNIGIPIPQKTFSVRCILTGSHKSTPSFVKPVIYHIDFENLLQIVAWHQMFGHIVEGATHNSTSLSLTDSCTQMSFEMSNFHCRNSGWDTCLDNFTWTITEPNSYDEHCYSSLGSLNMINCGYKTDLDPCRCCGIWIGCCPLCFGQECYEQEQEPSSKLIESQLTQCQIPSCFLLHLLLYFLNFG